MFRPAGPSGVFSFSCREECRIRRTSEREPAVFPKVNHKRDRRLSQSAKVKP
jgi:hypothetical protein